MSENGSRTPKERQHHDTNISKCNLEWDINSKEFELDVSFQNVSDLMLNFQVFLI